MNFWIDAQLPHSLAAWLSETFGVNATPFRDLSLRDAQDTEIFNALINMADILINKFKII